MTQDSLAPLQVAWVTDPGGATFGVLQASNEVGSAGRAPAQGAVGVPGTVCWTELLTRDVDACKNFYSTLFGWEARDIVVAGGAYTLFSLDGARVAGMMVIEPEKSTVPPHWMVHFACADVDRAAARATASGARIAFGPHDVPDRGRFVVFIDPLGAPFALWTSR